MIKIRPLKSHYEDLHEGLHNDLHNDLGNDLDRGQSQNGHKNWQAALEALLPQIYDSMETQRQILHFANHQAADGVIAMDLDEKPVGFLLLQVAGATAEIIDIGTAISARRRGIADAMLSHVLENQGQPRLESLFLEVAVDNHSAFGLYQKSGFVEIGRRKGYYTRGSGRVDAIQMQFSL